MAKAAVQDIDRCIGKRLQLLRKQHGLSAAALAESIGSTQQQISRYETGQNKIAAAQLYRLACLLGVPIGWFFLDGVDEPGLVVNEMSPVYAQQRLDEEMAILRATWPRLRSGQRVAVLNLLDSFLL